MLRLARRYHRKFSKFKILLILFCKQFQNGTHIKQGYSWKSVHGMAPPSLHAAIEYHWRRRKPWYFPHM